jgi:hypothetical protein
MSRNCLITVLLLLAVLILPVAAEEFTNGGFEAGSLTGWNSTSGTQAIISADKHTGSYAGNLTSVYSAEQDWSIISQLIDFDEAAGNLTFAYKAMPRGSASGEFFIGVYDASTENTVNLVDRYWEDGLPGNYETNSSGWVVYTIDTTGLTGQLEVRFGVCVYSDDNALSLFIDDVSTDGGAADHNLGFETGTFNEWRLQWGNVSVINTGARSGTYSGKVTSFQSYTSAPGLSHPVDFDAAPGNLTFWYNIDGTSTALKLEVYYVDTEFNNHYLFNWTNKTSGWVNRTVDTSAVTGIQEVVFSLVNTDAGDSAYLVLDDIATDGGAQGDGSSPLIIIILNYIHQLLGYCPAYLIAGDSS